MKDLICNMRLFRRTLCGWPKTNLGSRIVGDLLPQQTLRSGDLFPLVHVAQIDERIAAGAYKAYESVQTYDGITMPTCSSRIDFIAGASALDQFNHPAKCPSDEGIKQHRQQLHHMCSPGEVDVVEVLLLGHPPVVCSGVSNGVNGCSEGLPSKLMPLAGI